MATTRKKIREQVQLLYSNYIDKDAFDDAIDVRLIDIMIEQSINANLSVRFLNSMKVGEVQIPTCNIIEYTLTPSAGVVTLPVYPIQLPFDIGVWKVSLVSNGIGMVPINAAMSNVYGGTSAGYLEGQTGYVVKGNKIRFTTSVTAPVNVELLVSDFSTTSETDPLPISADVEALVVSDVLDKISQGRISQPELNVKQNAN